MSDVFFQPRLTGKRFDSHTLPVELLSDFAALEELIIELAKQKYLEAHPDRQRVPRGFSDGISLNLATIREGSTIPGFVLTSFLTANSLFAGSDPTLTYFEQAKETIITCVADAASKQIVDLEPRFIAYFNRIGRNLLEDEAIEFNPSSSSNKAVLTKQTRRKILLSVDQNAEYLDNATLIARISEMDKSKQTFTIENQTLRIAAVKIPSEHKDLIYKAFDEFELGNYIRLKGIAKFNSSSKIVMVETIEHLDILDAGDIEVRLEQISSLKSGWYNGLGTAYDKSQLDLLLSKFNVNYSNNLIIPATYPTVEGEIQLEWTTEKIDASLTINLDSLKGEFHSVNFSDQSDSEETFDLNDEASWQKLNLWLLENL